MVDLAPSRSSCVCLCVPLMTQASAIASAAVVERLWD
jgi:hypothetical protein